MANEDVIVEIGAEDNASGKLDNVADKTESMGTRVKSALEGAEGASKKFAIALAGIAAGAIAFGVKSLGAFNAQEQVSLRMEKLILNQEGATMAHVDALRAQASAMQKVTTYGDEVVMMAQGQFATFDITSESIQRLIPGFLDMVAAEDGASVSMETMKQRAQGFGKALVGQADALVKQGFIFTDLQKDILKTGTEQEKITVLTEVMGRTYDGMAATLRNTFKGQMQVAQNTLGDFMELIGEALSNYLLPAIGAFNRWSDSIGGSEGMMKKFVDILKAAQPYWFLIAGAIVGALIPALYAMLTAVIANVVALAPFIAIGTAIAALAYLIYQAYQTNFLGFRDVVQEAMEIIMPILLQFRDFWVLFSQEFVAFVELIKFAWETNMYGIRDIATAVGNTLKVYFLAWWDIIKGLFKIALGILTLDWETAWSGIKDVATGVFDLVALAASLFWKALGVAWDAGVAALSSAWGSLMEGIKGVASGVWEGIKQIFKDGINAIIRYINGFISAYSTVSRRIPGLPKIQEFTPLAEGGIVTKPTLALVGEAGAEAVIPLSKAGGMRGGGFGGVTILIEGNQFYGDDEEFALRIGDTLMKRIVPHLNFQTT